MNNVEIKTGIWNEDRMLSLSFPENWEVSTLWPDLPAPLSEDALRTLMEQPVGQPPLRELAKGKQKPCIIVDDLSRPTPVYQIIPAILDHFADAGIPAEQVKIVVGTGTHGHQDETGLRNKLGDMAMDRCQVWVHNDLENVRKIGKTSFGTPVFVDREVLDSDLLIGVGGVYPQNTTGFGGGGKLALGILGRRSIMGMHYRHPSMEGKYITDNDFRREVTEMAQMMGLKTIFTLHVNAYMEVVNMMCGDYLQYYDEAAAFSRDRYMTAKADDADVVIANAYPLDTSVTFMRKGYKPLAAAPRSSMKIMIASAFEGTGMHGLFRYAKPPPFNKIRVIFRKVRILGLKTIFKKAINRIGRKLGLIPSPPVVKKKVSQIPDNSDHLWLYRTTKNDADMPDIPEMTVLYTWEEVIDAIRKERGDGVLKITVYPCAPLQTLNL